MPVQHYHLGNYSARTSIGYLIKRAHAHLIDQLESVVVTRDLTFTQWVVLMYLREGIALNASELCAKLRHDSGALTRIIDQLEARGFVQRQRSLEDRRAVSLRLTDQGQQLLTDLLPAVIDKLNFALRDFTTVEVGELVRLLNKLGGDHDAQSSGELA